ncbi:MAG: sensor domain-containing diguanylate cyclase [Candidatus Electryonea clarkiae]|nr:sensor domain-containing diguanylate cyclase [Candidatus Electryonea clarkiae]
MPKKTPPNSASFYRTIDGAWQKLESKGLETAYRRLYLSHSLVGLLHSIFEAARLSEVQHGFAYIPERLVQAVADWPSGSTPHGPGLLTVVPNDERLWHLTSEQPRGNHAFLNELWIAWTGLYGTLVLVARRQPKRKRFGVSLDDLWHVGLSWDLDNVKIAVDAIANHKTFPGELKQQLDGMKSSYNRIGKLDKGASLVLPPVRSAVALADNLDPWTQRRLIEAQWVSIHNRIQDAVGGELRAERLLPAISSVLKKTINYDFMEIHIFTRVGKRYEEFISWRRNYTGYGDDKMSILLGEKLVTGIMKEKRPRIIRTERVDGVMNPHLIQLAGLKEGIVIPLVFNRRVQGLLMLFYRRSLMISTHEIEKVELISKTIARCIEASNAHTKVHRMATIDALTNISNRRYFNEQIKKEFKRARRYGHNLTMVMIDIDHFKHYNDTHGHLVGDRLLRELAQVLKANVREEDTVARYGGEEFALILPESDVSAGLLVAEKIRQSIMNTNFNKTDSQPLGRLTISLGVADNTGNIKTPRDLINNSDRALYRAKAKGRNCTIVYTSDLDSAA